MSEACRANRRAPSSPVPGIPPVERGRVAAWALWDSGATGVNAVVATFGFNIYLISEVGKGLPGPTTPESWLGRAVLVAGIAVALLAPVTGVMVDAAYRRRRALAALTGAVVVLTASMTFIKPDYHYLWIGLALLAATAACMDLATVPYNAMLRQLSTPTTSGRISGFGLAAGFFGSVVLLLLVFVGLKSGSGDTLGLLGVPNSDGKPDRYAVLAAAAWFVIFALPLLLTVKSPPHDGTPAVGFFGAYRRLWTEVVGEWRRDRNVVYYLLSSAVFRDGLTGISIFGPVVGVSVYGLAPTSVPLFGAGAFTIAALGAAFGGMLDDRIGSKRVIVGSLTAMVAVGITLMFLSGPLAFWICGLTLCLFVGPTQSASRNLMLRISADGKEGVAFGLYTTTGRAAHVLSPWLFSMFIDIFATTRAGLGGLCTVLALGLVGMLLVKVPARR
ncbi:MFS transporter [Mycolicibacterium sp. lyk4-40-TYG-92]|uniref:MFS transporter n=1 Tax=Mycolicibacterium sp. lyk4-40-TYG-92 TaxID=3040295 RepID=UPI00254C4C96|nr:MFS transporter [Mycolicibacterium sp. lyk4-40-TYG-92]